MQYLMGKQLRTARRAQALTQRQLADRAGMHIVTSSRLEHGTSAHIDADTLGELAVALGVSADYLWGLQDAGAPNTTAPAPPAKPQRQRTRNTQPVGEEDPVEPQEYDAIIRQLAATIAKQETIHEDLRACVWEQRDFNARQLVINQTIEATLARLEFIQGRIETLLARITRTEGRQLF